VICCLTAQRRAWRPGWRSLPRARWSVATGVPYTRMASVRGPPRPCRWAIAFIWAKTCATPSRPSCITRKPRCRRQRLVPRQRCRSWPARCPSLRGIAGGPGAHPSRHSGGRPRHSSGTPPGERPTRLSIPCTPRGSRSPRLPSSLASAAPRSLRICGVPGPRDADFALHPPAGTVSTGRRIHLGVP